MYILKRLKNGFRIEFSATFEGIDSVCIEAKKFLSDHIYDELSFDIILGIREILSNSVRHGSKMDSGKTILYSIEKRANSICIRIADKGAGFDWKEIEKRSPPVTAVSGRGITIVREVFDSYQFNEIGNEVQLEKKINKGVHR